MNSHYGCVGEYYNNAEIIVYYKNLDNRELFYKQFLDMRSTLEFALDLIDKNYIILSITNVPEVDLEHRQTISSSGDLRLEK
jgi:hypothetical protein